MPGLLPLLAELERAGVPKAIATSSGPDFVRRFCLASISRRGSNSFSPATTFDQGKPHPEIYLLAASRFGLEPAQLLVLEDSPNGCRAAVAAGTIAVAVPAGTSRRHDFSGAALVAEFAVRSAIVFAVGPSAGEHGLPRRPPQFCYAATSCRLAAGPLNVPAMAPAVVGLVDKSPQSLAKQRSRAFEDPSRTTAIE